MLRSLGNLVADFEKIGPLEGLEAKVLVVKVTIIDNGRVQFLCMCHDAVIGFLGDHGRRFIVLGADIVVEIRHDGGKLFFRLLV